MIRMEKRTTCGILDRRAFSNQLVGSQYTLEKNKEKT
jgi:hypothetical protein